MSKRKSPHFSRDFIEERLFEQKRIKLEIQSLPCGEYNYENEPSLCANCTKKTGLCSFIDLRAFKINENKKLEFGPYFPSSKGHDPLQAVTHTFFKPQPPNKKSKNLIIKYLKPVLSSIVANELKTIESATNSPIFRSFVPEDNHYCDSCMTTIFNFHYVCATCAYEICPDCYCDQNWERCLYKSPHTSEHFLLFEKYSEESQEEIMTSISDPSCLYNLTESVFEDTNEKTTVATTEETAIDTVENTTTATTADTTAATTEDTTTVTIENTAAAATAATEDTVVAATEKTTATTTATEETATVTIENTAAITTKETAVETDAIPDIISQRSEDLDYLTVPNEEMTLEIFQNEWKSSRPIVVKNTLEKSKINWSAAYFEKNYGQEDIEVIDCDGYKSHSSTAGEYFGAFYSPERRKEYAKKLGSSEVLKIKDWPPTENIASKFPELYQDFMGIVPVPEYTSAGGYFNLANRLPKECIPPDLGPKMFISYNSGKTNLHCDMADAVNIMNNAVQTAEETPAASIWHIFPSESSEELSSWLKSRHRDFLKEWHSIHSQSLFLEDKELKLLEEKTGIKPWKIHQNPGDAIFIPAGCPHQVYNYQQTIKCAVDFLSPENLEMSASITEEFSRLPKMDALQLKTTLLFAWKGLMN